MSDLSVRPANAGAVRTADALLRALGGAEVWLRMPAKAAGDDGEQLGLGDPHFQDLPLAPAIFRKARVAMVEGEPAKYELLLSASAVGAQLSAMELKSADVLFAMATGFVVSGALFLIEGTSFTAAMGGVCIYRVLLREAALQSD